MSAQIIDGKAVSARVRAEVAERVRGLVARGVTPGLTVLLAGEDPASATYVRNKEKAALECGIRGATLRFPADVSAATLAAELDRLNADPEVDGILVQLPLPPGISAEDSRALQRRIAPEKDVDGFLPFNQGLLMIGEPGFVPCTPAGCMRLLAEAGVSPRGKHAVVVGRSNIVGKPMAMLLLAADATVTIAHSRTPDLAAVVRTADIVVAAVGRPGLVRGDWLKPGAVVLDVGINRLPDGKLGGDVAFAEAVSVASAITPVPGGVGPMTIACLLENVCRAAERRLPPA
jgi:methylenetetrahydrofolate dehydrogenase (NADP+)/methenyltetrahydrofolate cyclohydrolase